MALLCDLGVNLRNFLCDILCNGGLVPEQKGEKGSRIQGVKGSSEEVFASDIIVLNFSSISLEPWNP
jgi:hypothetical protein